MKKFKRGFTLIEVILFLGLTAALFAGIAAGVGNSVYQQRYSDAIQNYAEFLRSVYAQVGNVQSESGGRSNQAIYGKVMTFRAKEVEGDGGTKGNVIKTYNLVGDLEMVTSAGDVNTNVVDNRNNVNCKSTSVITRLQCLEANVLVKQDDSTYKPVGFVQEYQPRWDSEIQTTAGWNSGYEVFEGIVLIARSPTSGNVSTYVWMPQDSDQLNEIRKVIDNIDNCVKGENCQEEGDIFRTKVGKDYSTYDTYNTYMSADLFQPVEIDFCLNPNGSQLSSIRRDIRIVKGARNASGINILDEDKVEVDPETGLPVDSDDKMDKNRCQ